MKRELEIVAKDLADRSKSEISGMPKRIGYTAFSLICGPIALMEGMKYRIQEPFNKGIYYPAPSDDQIIKARSSFEESRRFYQHDLLGFFGLSAGIMAWMVAFKNPHQYPVAQVLTATNLGSLVLEGMKPVYSRMDKYTQSVKARAAAQNPPTDAE
jgi:hypothetical protein